MTAGRENAEWSQQDNATLAELERGTTVAEARADKAVSALRRALHEPHGLRGRLDRYGARPERVDARPDGPGRGLAAGGGERPGGRRARAGAAGGGAMSEPLTAERLEDRVREHREVLHRPLRALPERPDLRAAYVDPVPDADDGRLVYKEPRACAGVTECSKAFFLLNRHRLGRIVAAGMRDFMETVNPHRGDACLRLYDAAGRVLALAGMTAG
jgi:hypothetical protein